MTTGDLATVHGNRIGAPLVPLIRILLIGLTAAAVAVPTLPASAADMPSLIPSTTAVPLTEHDVCRLDARPAPGPPTWWPSSGHCPPAPSEAPDAGGVPLDGTTIALAAAAIAAGAAIGGRIRNRRRRWKTGSAVSDRIASG